MTDPEQFCSVLLLSFKPVVLNLAHKFVQHGLFCIRQNKFFKQLLDCKLSFMSDFEVGLLPDNFVHTLRQTRL